MSEVDWANNPPTGFDWDAEKYAETLRDHGIRLEYAILVFNDPDRLEMYDDREDYGEDRFYAIGVVFGRLIRVAFTLRGADDEITRVITAFRASASERRTYERSHKRR